LNQPTKMIVLTAYEVVHVWLQSSAAASFASLGVF